MNSSILGLRSPVVPSLGFLSALSSSRFRSPPSLCAAADLLGPGEPLRRPEHLNFQEPSTIGFGASLNGHFSARSVP